MKILGPSIQAPIFQSGASHVEGIVPDPGSSTDANTFLSAAGWAELPSETATSVTYTTSVHPTITNVQQALDQIFYVAMTSSMSGGNTYENGQSIASVALTWSFSKTLSAISLTGPNATQPTLAQVSETVTGPYTTNQTWTIHGTANDGVGETSQSSTSLTFENKVYWGISANTSLTDAQIIALSSALAVSRNQTRVFNPGGDYIYFAWPSSFGEPTFTIGGLVNSAWTEVVRAFVNASGYSTSYNIYRSNTVQNGSNISIVVT
jgi:hypothetical protein